MVGALRHWLLRFDEMLRRAPEDNRDLSSIERIYLFVF